MSHYPCYFILKTLCDLSSTMWLLIIIPIRQLLVFLINVLLLGLCYRCICLLIKSCNECKSRYYISPFGTLDA